MTKGTWSKGKRNKKSHGICPRCGRRAFHNKKKTCASCGYPNAKTRKFNWCTKAKRRRRTGTGRMRYMRRALKRKSNRDRFHRLPSILKTAILNAIDDTKKRMPPKRAIKKQLRLEKTKLADKRAKRRVFIESLAGEVARRLAAKKE